MNDIAAGERRRRERARRSRRARETIEGYLFVLPAALVILVFGICPVFFTVIVSLNRWRIKPGAFIGLENYLEIFGGPRLLLWVAAAAALLAAAAWLRRGGRVARRLSGALAIAFAVLILLAVLPQIRASGDAEMLDSLRVTVWYSVGTVPVQLALGLMLALLLDAKFRGKQAFRVIFLLPYVVPAVASATVFERLFSLRPESFANLVLALFHVPTQQWLRETRGIFEMAFGWGRESAAAAGAYWMAWARGPSLALASIMFYNYWVFTGYYALIYANGLASIPRELYEAAEVDGARRSTVFFKIVIPLLSPTTFFLSTLGVIGTFKAFNHIYVLRSPDAQGAADPVSVYIFFTFFRKSRFGYAAALALVLFAIVMGLTYLQRRVMTKRVFYGDD